MQKNSRNILLMMDVRLHFHRLKLLVGLLVFVLLATLADGHTTPSKFSQQLDGSDSGFIPFQPINLDSNYFSQKLFSETGQYRIFSSADESDLRQMQTTPSSEFNPKQNEIDVDVEEEETLDMEIKSLEKLAIKYAEDFMSRDTHEIVSGVRVEHDKGVQSATPRNGDNPEMKTFDKLQQFAESHIISVNMPRALESGRLFFFAGLKKIMWPIFIGLQIVKSMLLALFLPSLLGSLGKIVGKAVIPGISSVSGFNRPSETVGDLEFKDTTYEFEDNNKMVMNPDYMYRPEASTTNFATQMYDAATLNNNALSRYGVGDKDNSVGTNYYNSKNSVATINAAQNNNFKVFQNVPASSLLLSNYDPFYSPLLSRLDSVFQQMGLAAGNEVCREKLVCLMYANPAKYAPYSNLVSAQLSRELNELRKPTSDNPDILRFFKYMRAAKDGQDGVSCEKVYATCETFKDSDNPAMVTTYHDINKLVQARKLTK